MRKITLTLALICISMANAQKWGNNKVEGDGKKTTITRSTSEYDEIAVAGSFRVDLVAGKEGTITLEGDENLLEYVKTEVDGNQLKIQIDKNVSFKNGHRQISITIPFEKISKVSFTGSGDIETKNSINAENFEINFAGSGDGNFEVNSPNLKVALAGSGDLNVTGTSTNLIAKVAGSGDLDCSKLEAQNAEATVAGSGDLKVNCTNKLTARVAGSGDISYKGKPESVDKKVNGSGDITSY